MTMQGMQVKFTIPEGAPPGTLLSVPVRGGAEQVKVRVPDGCGAGSTLILTQPEGTDQWDMQVGDVVPAPPEQQLAPHSPGSPKSYQPVEAPAPSAGLDPTVAYTVRLDTTVGLIDIIVRPDWAPLGTRRFLELAAAGDLTDLSFYRAIKGCIVQFGLPAKRTWPCIQDDPPTGVPFLLGAVSFAAIGENTRRSTLFICIGDMSHMLGQKSWETPIGAVAESSLDILERLDTTYGDIAEFGGAGPDTNRINTEGNAYLRSNFPNLSYIRSAWPVDWPLAEENGSGSPTAAAVPVATAPAPAALSDPDAAVRAAGAAQEAQRQASIASAAAADAERAQYVAQARQAAQAAQAAAQAAQAAADMAQSAKAEQLAQASQAATAAAAARSVEVAQPLAAKRPVAIVGADTGGTGGVLTPSMVAPAAGQPAHPPQAPQTLQPQPMQLSLQQQLQQQQQQGQPLMPSPHGQPMQSPHSVAPLPPHGHSQLMGMSQPVATSQRQVPHVAPLQPHPAQVAQMGGSLTFVSGLQNPQLPPGAGMVPPPGAGMAPPPGAGMAPPPGAGMAMPGMALPGMAPPYGAPAPPMQMPMANGGAPFTVRR